MDCGLENIVGVNVVFTFSLSRFLTVGVISCREFDRGEKKDRMDFGGVGGFGLYDDT
jgi:hypothetical protein